MLPQCYLRLICSPPVKACEIDGLLGTFAAELLVAVAGPRVHLTHLSGHKRFFSSLE